MSNDDAVESWRERIHSDPGVMNGRPVVRGSRVTVEYLLAWLADTPNIDNAVAEFRNIERSDVLAAVGFAAYMVGERPDAARRLAASGTPHED